MGEPPEQVSFRFQFGAARERASPLGPGESHSLGSLKARALAFLATYGASGSRPEGILLFKHDYGSDNVLQIVNSVSDVCEDSLIEIVIQGSRSLSSPSPVGGGVGATASSTSSSSTIVASASSGGGEDPSASEAPLRPHTLSIHSYKTPTFCHFCGEMLFGMFKQGLKCEDCGLNFHKRCVFKIPNDCSNSRKKRSDQGGSTFGAPGSSPSLISCTSVSSSTSERGPLIPKSNSIIDSTPISPGGRNSSNMAMALHLRIPHTFCLHTYTKPTKCHRCNKMLVGVFKQGLQCKDCGYNAHKKCTYRAPPDCTGEVSEKIDETIDFDQSIGEEDSDEDSSSNGKNDSEPPKQSSPSSGAQPNIPVQRLVQSVRHTKRPGSRRILKEGWLVHFTNKGSMRKRHYWRLDTKTITLFQSDSGANYYKEIPLSDIVYFRSCPGGVPLNHVFEMSTTNMVYFVGEDAWPKEELGVGVKLALDWEEAIRSALNNKEDEENEEDAALAANSRGGEGHGNEGLMNSLTLSGGGSPPSSGSSSGEDKLSSAYQIYSDKILGSGQFGIVYAGSSRSKGTPVAIKVINKLRFPSKQEAALKNEVSILQNLFHPGVVNLEAMFETQGQIYVVMEKLEGDMLEMILGSDAGRLSERVAKFLVTQILVALKHLHSKNIVHCDLKPENVLLSSNSDFPQVKLCDFGFARIIGEKGFRKSVVGTPAYLAPEVLRKKGYNRSLDMWSTGVIIYVSLSGTFPFNEDEDINEQIQNASFMYPSRPWKSIDTLAIDLIGNLLQVKSRKRISVDKALLHAWLTDYQCWLDLKDLEAKVGSRWLTHESDDERWELYRKLYMEKEGEGPPLPSSNSSTGGALYENVQGTNNGSGP